LAILYANVRPRRGVLGNPLCQGAIRRGAIDETQVLNKGTDPEVSKGTDPEVSLEFRNFIQYTICTEQKI